jgi:hypothetical protein
VFSQDGDRLAIVHFEGAGLVDASGKYVPLPRTAGFNGGSTPAFDRSGTKLAMASDTAGVVVWDVSGPPRPLVRFQVAGAVQAVAFSPDGRFLAVGLARPGWPLFGGDGQPSMDAVQLVAASSGSPVGEPFDVGTEGSLARGDNTRISSLTFSSDGRRIVVAHSQDDRVGSIKTISLGDLVARACSMVTRKVTRSELRGAVGAKVVGTSACESR